MWIIDPVIHNNILYSGIQLPVINAENMHAKIYCEVIFRKNTIDMVNEYCNFS